MSGFAWHCVADLLHLRLRALLVRPRLRDRVGEVVREPVGRIVRDLLAVDAAHVAGRAGRHEHVARRQRFRRRVEIQQALLRVEHHAVLRLLVDLELRVIGPHVALPAGRRQPRDRDRARVPRVARRAACRSCRRRSACRCCGSCAQPLVGRRRAFERDQRMRRPLRVAGLISLGEIDLLRRQALRAEHRRPRHAGVTAAQELLVDRLVAAAAVARRQLRDDREAVMLLLRAAPPPADGSRGS